MSARRGGGVEEGERRRRIIIKIKIIKNHQEREGIRRIHCKQQREKKKGEETVEKERKRKRENYPSHDDEVDGDRDDFVANRKEGGEGTVENTKNE